MTNPAPSSDDDLWALSAALDARLRGAGVVTLALEEWCRERKLVGPVRAVPLAGEAPPLSTAILDVLKVREAVDLRFRRVRLWCGDVLLSEAENWFVPARLTSDMNHALATTDAPFGRIVLGLSPSRKTCSVEQLWRPNPRTIGDRKTDDQDAAPHGRWLFRHRAVILGGAGEPLAHVTETYAQSALGLS